MTKISLFPWVSNNIKTATKCEMIAEQSGFLTGSTFLPWRSLVVPGDVLTSFNELFEEGCGSLNLQHTEVFEEGCGSLNLQHTEVFEEGCGSLNLQHFEECET